MSSEIEIGVGVAKLKITLSEFANVVRNLVGEAKHQEVRQAVKELIEAALTSYDTTVGVLTPLYAIDTQAKLSSDFAKCRSQFKNQYLRDIGRLHTHCSIVENKIRNLKDKKRFMASLPVINRSFNKLDGLAELWLARDYALARDMDQFLHQMNNFLDAIPLWEPPLEAFEYLRWSLSLFESEFVAMKKCLEELRVISSGL